MRRFLRPSGNDLIIDRLYAVVVEASRNADLFRLLDVPDTFEGRFESLVVHAALVLRRLQAAETPGPDMAQHLVDTVFRHLDRTLREMGIGDTTVPKRMKVLVEAFLGRSAAYETALRAEHEALVAALARNVYSGRRDGVELARYVAATAVALNEAPLQSFIDGAVPFIDPAAFATKVTP